METQYPNPLTWKKNQAKNGGYSFDFARVKSSAIEQIKDGDDLNKGINDLKVVPYSSNDTFSADSLLNFFNRTRHFSPTLGAVYFAIKQFTLHTRLTPVPRKDPDFDFGEEIEPIDIAIKKKYKEDLLDNIKYNKSGAGEVVECNFDDLFDNGNNFVEVVLSQTMDVKGGTINYHHSETVKHVIVTDGIPKVAISLKWDSNYVGKHPPRIVPLFPNAGRDKDGVLRTMIHEKIGNFQWYGRPIWLGAWLHTYREYQDVDYLIKAADNMFTGQVVIEYEGDEDPETGGDSDDNNDAVNEGPTLVEKIDNNFTAKADNPQTVLAMERPYGASAVTVVQIKPNLNETFYEKENTKNRQKIFEILSWSSRLLGSSEGGSGFQGDAFISELQIKDKGVLNFFREKSIKSLNTAYRIIDSFINGGEFDFIEMTIPSLFEGKKSLKTSEVKDKATTIGALVRAGMITPTKEDEMFWRNIVEMGELSQDAIDAWEEDGNVRRPITLKGQEQLEDENNLALGKAKKVDDEDE